MLSKSKNDERCGGGSHVMEGAEAGADEESIGTLMPIRRSECETTIMTWIYAEIFC